jgi:hypothetical protein
MTIFLGEFHPIAISYKMKAVRDVQGNVRAMAEGRSDTPEVIKMLVTDHQRLDPARLTLAAGSETHNQHVSSVLRSDVH